MFTVLKLLSINPVTKWLQWLIMRYKLRKINKTLSVGYMSIVINSVFSQENHIFPYAKLLNVKLGKFTYVGGNTHIKNTSIGHFTSIASDCRIGLGIHPTNLVSTHPLFYASKHEWSITPIIKIKFKEYKDIIIGNDVWIGTRVTIVDGVKIGNGAIIAAGAVVTKDVPPYAIFGGVPAQLIKFRFPNEINQKIEESEWWNWEIAKIKEHKSKFLSQNDFINDFAK